jgi:hypothetical protein
VYSSCDPSIDARARLARGQVTTPSVLMNTTGSAEMGRCLADEIARWQFDPRISGAVQWPFVFKQK